VKKNGAYVRLNTSNREWAYILYSSEYTMLMVTAQVADLNHEKLKSSRVMRW